MFSQDAPPGTKTKTIALVFMLTSTFALASAEENLVERKVPCDELYPHCPMGALENLFHHEFRDHQLIYSVELEGKLTLGRELFSYVDLGESQRSKGTSANRSVILTRKSECEFDISFGNEDEEQGEAHLRVVMINGFIKRTCYSGKDVSNPEINILKAIASALQNSDPISPEVGTLLEETPRGTCLTQYVRCSESDDVTISYQSFAHCSKNMDSGGEQAAFQRKIQCLSERQASFCRSIKENDSTPAIELLRNAFSDTSGITVCMKQRDKTSKIFQTSACYEYHDLDKILSERANGYFSIVLQHRTSVPAKMTPYTEAYYLTSLAHVPKEQVYGNPEVLLDVSQNFEERISEVVKSLTNLENFRKFESATLIKKAMTMIRSVSSTEDLINGLKSVENIPSEDMMSVNLYLKLVASEAKSATVLKFFKTIFSDDSFTTKFFIMDNYDSVLEKLYETISDQKSTSTYLLEFTKFLIDFINGGENSFRFSSELKLKSLISFSEHINQFCNAMEVKTGMPYCKNDPTLLEWISSSIIEKIRGNYKYIDKFRFIEGLNIFEHHFNQTLCEEVYWNRPIDQLGYHAILNCHKERSCLTGKIFYRKIFENRTKLVNERIAAFLGLTKCLDEMDIEVINTELKSSSDLELVHFIKTFKHNRERNGISKLEGIKIPDRSDWNTGNFGQASNTFLSYTTPAFPIQIELETNVLYFQPKQFDGYQGLSSMIPNIITIFVNFAAKDQKVYDMELQVYTEPFFTSSNSELGFNVTAICKLFGRTEYIWTISLTREEVMQWSLELQKLIMGNSEGSLSPTMYYWILRFIENDFFLDRVNFNKVFTGIKSLTVQPTVAGILWRHSKRMDSYLRLTVNKTNCPDIFTDNVEAPCVATIHYESNLDMRSYFGLQRFDFDSDSVKEEGFLPTSHFSFVFPISLTVDKSKTELVGLNETVVITAPSLRTPFHNYQIAVSDVQLKDNQIEKTELVLGGNNMLSLSNRYSLPVKIPEEEESLEHWSNETLKIIFEKNDKETTLKIQDTLITARFNIGTDPICMIQGHISKLNEHESTSRSYSVKVGAKNTENYKRLHTEVTVEEENKDNNKEYSIDAFYIHQVKNTEDFRHHGVFSCHTRSGKGILCWWPFCAFCGSEYSIGALLATPKYKFKLFEASVKQIFPDKRIDIVFETNGIPVIRSGSVKLSLERGDDTTIFQETTFKDTIQKRLSVLQQVPQNNVKMAYFFKAVLNGHLIGSSEVSTALLGISNPQIHDKEELWFHGLTLTHKKDEQSKDYAERLFSYCVSLYDKNTNLSQLSMYEFSESNAIFPILDVNASVRREKMRNYQEEKVAVQMQPYNAVNGTIRLEMIYDTAGDSLDQLLYAESWANIYLNQTFTVHFPPDFKTRNLKTKLILKRVNGELEVAGIDSVIGLDDGFEFKYEALQPENVLKILTSVTYDGEFYGFHHKLEPDQSGIQTEVATEDDSEGIRYKYDGTYILADSSFKAKGYFLGRKGKEILPFRKFNIKVASPEGTEIGIRIFGMENVFKEKIHYMHFGVNKGDTVLFEASNELNPDDTNPMKATISMKDYGDLKLVDTSKSSGSRYLQLNSNMPNWRKQIEGKIAFPAKLLEPLFLDMDVTVRGIGNLSQPILKIRTNSSLEFTNKFGASSENMLQVRNSVWEFNLDGLYANERYSKYDEDTFEYTFKNDKNITFSVRFVQPDEGAYGLSVSSRDYSTRRDDMHRYNLKAERPNKTPLNLRLELDDMGSSKNEDIEGVGRNWIADRNVRGLAKLCHRDNFLFILPVLDTDMKVEISHVSHTEGQYIEHQKTETETASFRCQSEGLILQHLCNQINASYEHHNKYKTDYSGPWIAKFKAKNTPEIGLTHEVDWKLEGTYEVLKSMNFTFDRDNIILDLFSTTYGDKLRRSTYNIEYDYHHDLVYMNGDTKEKVNGFELNGTYVFSKMFESWDHFEISDEHRWKLPGAGNFYIWTNRVNHTSDPDQSKDYASVFSQYVSLGDKEPNSDNGKDNITYMELRSALNSDGFGPLLSVIMQPHILFTRAGDIEADFLIRSEFTRLKNFHFVASHQQRGTEDEDDESMKFTLLDQLNVIMNERELSASNSITLVVGKYMAFANSLSGRYGAGSPTDGIYEYLTLKAFALSPLKIETASKDNLIHVDVFTSWTNADDDDTEMRIVREAVYDLREFGYDSDSDDDFPITNAPFGRFSIYTNSTDLWFAKNTSYVAYHSKPSTKVPDDMILRLPENFIAEGVDELNFSQESLQSLSQQIIEDYYNKSFLYERDQGGSGNMTWPDYNFDGTSRSTFQDVSFNSEYKATLYGVNEKLFQCKSSLETCQDNGTSPITSTIDTSNYCNLAILPAKPLMWTVVEKGKVPFWVYLQYFNIVAGYVGF